MCLSESRFQISHILCKVNPVIIKSDSFQKEKNLLKVKPQVASYKP